MLKKRGRRRLWAVLGTMLLAAALGVCALAASDVPKAVLNARESVVRIMTEGRWAAALRCPKIPSMW